MTPHQHKAGNAGSAFLRSKISVVLIMLFAIGAFYLVREHFNHIAPYLAYLILLICPLMHFLGHGHGGHAGPAETDKDEKGNSHV